MAASKMKVEELRTELHQRGLTITGTKPTLVRRLEAALRKETQHSAADSDAAPTRRKRTRNSHNDNSNASEKLTTTRSRNSNKQLVETIPQDFDYAEQEEEVKEEEKIVTATKKGAAVLDQWLPDHIKAQYHVLQLASQITLANSNAILIR